MTTLRRVLPICLFIAFSAQVLFLVRDKSPTTDEVSFHMVNGYVNLRTLDFRMSPAAPPLLREWIALPWLAIRPVLRLDRPSWREADSVPFAVEFFYGDNRAVADRLLVSSRLMIGALGLAALLLVAAWARELYGTGGALAALALGAFCPTFVAHSALAALDVGSAFFYFLNGYVLWRETRGEGKALPWKTAVAFGLGLSAKFTQVLFFPLIVWAVLRKKGLRRGVTTLAGMFLISAAALWATYGFEFKPLLHGDVPRIEEKIGYVRQIARAIPGSGPALQDAAVRFAREVPVPLPSWILGFAGIARSHRTEYLHFFMGRWTNEGIWYHYLAAFFFKATLPFLLLLALRALTWFKVRREADFFLLAPVLILFGATLFDSTGVGIRYLLPAFPFLFVWAGGLMAGKKPLRFAAAVLVAAHAVSSLSQFPNNIAFFNEMARPDNGWKYLKYSDLDWGQELAPLARYAKRKGIKRLKTHLFGTRDEAYYGLPEVPIYESEYETSEPEIYAVSGNYVERFKWTKGREPDDRIGNAIFIYDMR